MVEMCDKCLNHLVPAVCTPVPAADRLVGRPETGWASSLDGVFPFLACSAQRRRRDRPHAARLSPSGLIAPGRRLASSLMSFRLNQQMRRRISRPWLMPANIVGALFPADLDCGVRLFELLSQIDDGTQPLHLAHFPQNFTISFIVSSWPTARQAEKRSVTENFIAATRHARQVRARRPGTAW